MVDQEAVQVLSVPLVRVLMVIARHPACPCGGSLARRRWSALLGVARRWRWPSSPFLLYVGQRRAASRPGRLSFAVMVRGLPHYPTSPISFLSTRDLRHVLEDGGRASQSTTLSHGLVRGCSGLGNPRSQGDAVLPRKRRGAAREWLRAAREAKTGPLSRTAGFEERAHPASTTACFRNRLLSRSLQRSRSESRGSEGAFGRRRHGTFAPQLRLHR